MVSMRAFRGNLIRFRGGVFVTPLYTRARVFRDGFIELLGFLMRKGLRRRYIKIIAHFLLLLYRRRFIWNATVEFFSPWWTNFLKRLAPKFDVYFVRSGPNKLPVPKGIMQRKRYYFAHKWFFDAVAVAPNAKGTFSARMASEVESIRKRTSAYYKIRFVWHRRALSNMALMHRPRLPLPKRRRYRRFDRRRAFSVRSYVPTLGRRWY